MTLPRPLHLAAAIALALFSYRKVSQAGFLLRIGGIRIPAEKMPKICSLRNSAFRAQFPSLHYTEGVADSGEYRPRRAVKDDSLQQGVLDVRMQLFFWRWTVICGLFLVTSAWGQGATQTPSPTKVVVIDISKVFEEHPGFKQTMDAMKQEVLAFENELKNRGKEMENLRAQLKDYKTGSPELKQLEAQILKVQADGQILATQKKRDLLDREAQLYYNVYTEIEKEIAAYAKHFQIGLVLRYNSTSMNPADQRSIMEGVNKAVIYQSGIDITQNIINQIARRFPQQTAAPAAAGAKSR